MLSLVLKYWKFGIGALVGAGLMFGVCELRIMYISASHALKIENAKQAVIAQCEQDKKLTLEVSNEYENEISALNDRMHTLNRVRYAVCVPITNTSGECNAATGGRYANRNGINAGALYGFAGRAEKHRRQLKACQSFITKTWEAKKHPR